MIPSSRPPHSHHLPLPALSCPRSSSSAAKHGPPTPIAYAGHTKQSSSRNRFPPKMSERSDFRMGDHPPRAAAFDPPRTDRREKELSPKSPAITVQVSGSTFHSPVPRRSSDKDLPIPPDQAPARHPSTRQPREIHPNERHPSYHHKEHSHQPKEIAHQDKGDSYRNKEEDVPNRDQDRSHRQKDRSHRHDHVNRSQPAGSVVTEGSPSRTDSRDTPKQGKNTGRSHSRLPRDEPEWTKATAKDAAFMEGMEAELTCPICMSVMAGPQQLVPCGHAICGACCVTWLESRVDARAAPTCPSCRSTIPSSQPMIPAINLEAMIHKWVEEQMRRGGWDGYEDWKERDQIWKFHRELNPTSLSAGNPQPSHRRAHVPLNLFGVDGPLEPALQRFVRPRSTAELDMMDFLHPPHSPRRGLNLLPRARDYFDGQRRGRQSGWAGPPPVHGWVSDFAFSPPPASPPQMHASYGRFMTDNHRPHGISIQLLGGPRRHTSLTEMLDDVLGEFFGRAAVLERRAAQSCWT